MTGADAIRLETGLPGPSRCRPPGAADCQIGLRDVKDARIAAASQRVPRRPRGCQLGSRRRTGRGSEGGGLPP